MSPEEVKTLTKAIIVKTWSMIRQLAGIDDMIDGNSDDVGDDEDDNDDDDDDDDCLQC